MSTPNKSICSHAQGYTDADIIDSGIPSSNGSPQFVGRCSRECSGYDLLMNEPCATNYQYHTDANTNELPMMNTTILNWCTKNNNRLGDIADRGSVCNAKWLSPESQAKWK